MGAALYYGQPINWNHPLNRGLVARWKVVPWYSSGPRLIDLAGLAGKKNGTLSGPTWQSQIGRQGGFGSLQFDATDDVVSVSGISLAGECTFAGWARATETGANRAMIAENITSFGIRKESFEKIQWLSDGYGVAATGATAAPLNTWYQWGGQRAGSTGSWTMRVYLNGKEDGNTTTASNSTIQPIFLGQLFAATQVWAGQLDDWMIWNRALSASEMLSLFQCTRMRQDPTLSWIEDDDLFAPTAAGGTAVPVFYQHLVTQGMA